MTLNNSQKTSRTTIVKNEFGMHARPASKIARIADKASARVWLSAHESRVDATSIIDILTLNAVTGTQVVIEIENDLDLAVLDQIFDFFEESFGEQ